MRRPFLWLLLLSSAGALWLLSTPVARGQSPVEKEVLANPAHLAGDQFLYDLACQGSGVCIVLWDYGVFSADDVFQGVRLGATTLAPAGGIRRERIYAEDPFELAPLAAAVGQRFSVFWDKTVPGPNGVRSQPVFQSFGPDLEQLSDVIHLPEPAEGLRAIVQAARIPGGFVELWAGNDKPLPDPSDGVFLSFSGDSGEELRAPIRVSAEADGEQSPSRGGLAVDLRRGVITAVYTGSRDAEPFDAGVFCRRFSLTGEPLTPDLRMNATQTNSQGWGFPAIATAPNGGFVAVWMSREQDGSELGIFGRRFGQDGLPLGPEFQVNQVTFSDQSFPRIASDAVGNFVVVWQSYDPSSFGVFAWDIKARLYQADGRPVGPEIFVNRVRELEQESPLVDFASNGTFMIAWHSNRYQPPPAADTGHDIIARRFSASPADEPCLVGGGKFRCDTGRTGGELEIEHSFGGPGSGLGFLGDVDGDGREDPCVYTGGTFRCDTDHEGGAAEVRIAFATTGAAVPLLGDMDGDGRADPCLATPGNFACDTRHDGGAAELRIRFGQPGETLLLGDLDGDHRAEACAFAGGLFRCDTGHDGGKAELLIRFGQRGDQPLLGDFDGDGRDDPCVFRQGTLLCDTAHDGGAAEATLKLGGPGDFVVLANLDGL